MIYLILARHLRAAMHSRCSGYGHCSIRLVRDAESGLALHCRHRAGCQNGINTGIPKGLQSRGN